MTKIQESSCCCAPVAEVAPCCGVQKSRPEGECCCGPSCACEDCQCPADCGCTDGRGR